jgi:hypothetical protein
VENQIRGRAAVFGACIPRALSPTFIEQALMAGNGIKGLSACPKQMGWMAPAPVEGILMP